MKWNKPTMQGIVSSVFAFLLTLLFVALYVCAGFILGVFDNKSVTRAIYESSYYNNVYDELNRSTEAIMKEAGIPTTVLADVITLDRVYIGSKNYVEKALRGEEVTIKTDKLREKLTENLNAYLQKENVIRTTTLDSNIANIIDLVESKYKDTVQLQLAKDIIKYKKNYENMIRIIILGLVAAIGLLSYFLIRLYQYKHRGIRYIVYALITSSLLTIATAFILLKTKQYTNIDVNPGYYKNLVTAYLRWDTMVFIYMGGIGLTIAAALAYVVYHMKSRLTFH